MILNGLLGLVSQAFRQEAEQGGGEGFSLRPDKGDDPDKFCGRRIHVDQDEPRQQVFQIADPLFTVLGQGDLKAVLHEKS